jgi:hypothetical protein
MAKIDQNIGFQENRKFFGRKNGDFDRKDCNVMAKIDQNTVFLRKSPIFSPKIGPNRQNN